MHRLVLGSRRLFSRPAQSLARVVQHTLVQSVTDPEAGLQPQGVEDWAHSRLRSFGIKAPKRGHVFFVFSQIIMDRDVAAR